MIDKLSDIKQMQDNFKLSKQAAENQCVLKTGYNLIDEYCGGLKNRQLYFLGARPSIGKTTFCINAIFNALQNLKENEVILFLSLEMDSTNIYKRLLSIHSHLNLNEWDYSASDTPEYAVINSIMKHSNSFLLKLNLLVFENLDNEQITPNFINSLIKDLKQKNKIVKAVFIDYFQLLTPNLNLGLDHEKLSSISKDLKQLAKQNDLNVFVLTQLSRDYEKKGSGTPSFSDLKGTSSIEQDADVILFLYSKNIVESAKTKELVLSLAKNRNGYLSKNDIDFQTPKAIMKEVENENENL
ncbi:DnaB-like helicase C-terminal domain-containing protein [Metamycoplasma buccale]|uniref:DnaB-like helicase C-terminal domain-containing protein n=1 Tax=Metamycoplasma buccale TaxID=55602 RepID=UPI00398E3D22